MCLVCVFLFLSLFASHICFALTRIIAPYLSAHNGGEERREGNENTWNAIQLLIVSVWRSNVWMEVKWAMIIFNRRFDCRVINSILLLRCCLVLFFSLLLIVIYPFGFIFDVCGAWRSIGCTYMDSACRNCLGRCNDSGWRQPQR